jgi:hypothetical protein
MNWYKQAQIQEKTFWHISNARFKKFDFYKSAQGIIWFAKDKEDLIKNLHGASINNKNPIYLYKCQINMGKVAGWNEYEKYGLGQLKSEGYDAINLDDDVAVLEPKNITILGIEQIR